MNSREYEQKKKRELQQALVVYAIITGALAYGCCIAVKNIIPLIIWIIATGYIYNKSTD